MALIRIWPPFGPLESRDFDAFWLAGRLVLEGHPAAVYSSLSAIAESLLGLHASQQLFPYPPTALMIFTPLALLPYRVAFAAWDIATLAFFLFAAISYLPKGFPKLLLISPAVIVNLAFGQAGLLYAGLWLLAFDGKWAATSLLTFKPHLGFLAGIEAIRRKQVPVALLGFAILVLASLVLFGADTWVAWVEKAVPRQTALLNGERGVWYWQMTTPALGYGMVGWAIYAATAAYLLSRSFNVFSAATAAFLIAPYGFNYDMPVVCLGFAIMLYRNQLSPISRAIAILCFFSPGMVYFGTWLIPPVLLFGLMVQTSAEARKPALS